MDDSGPLAIEGQAEFNAQGWHDVSETCRITYRYPNDVTLIVGQQQRDIGMGTKFIGEKGTLHVDRGNSRPTQPRSWRPSWPRMTCVLMRAAIITATHRLREEPGAAHLRR
ncbi:MAG: hypothetical protein R3B96_10670 [Pirellulaceae bacterium]